MSIHRLTWDVAPFSRRMMSAFQPMHFVPAIRRPQILKLPVQRILAVGHEKIEGPTNHWCIYLSTSDDTSIRVDCQPSHSVPSTVIRGGSKANLLISELSSATSPDAQTRFVIDVVPGLLVEKVMDVITDNGRHKYEFDEQGVGCRYWTTDLIDLSHEQGITTNASQILDAKAGILTLWPDETPLPLDQGAYYQ
ncbi:hypothetical protein N7452_011127 [Penicillium brevicompactum]|uniref:DUF7770 domain-containing protein n=1 Tax=Penicillium brevicompactum TaxID=5074 RepID=A0A9W9Q3F8_PENBR|nr:hypothetical protein N7452_011127 [Penicillium brevicompactum]